MWELLVWLFIYVAIPAGLAYLGGLLMAPSQPKAEEAVEGGQSRSWNPHTLQQEGIVRPRAYGENLHHGNIINKWTDVVDNREVLYLLLDHGDGPTNGIVTPLADNVFINNQPVGNFTSVTVQERLGTMNQTVMTGFEKPKLDYVINTKLLHNEAIVFTTPSDIFDDLEYTILFPDGLRKYKKTGERRSSNLTLKVRIAVKDSGSWTDISPATISANILEPYFRSYKISDYFAITRGVQYDIEFTNLDGPSSRHVRDVSLRSVREVIETAFTHPGRALVGIRAIATTQLSGSIDVKVIREDRVINTWNGSTWTLEYSNNRAWVAWDIMTLPVITGDGGGTPYAIERYDGIDPQYLDLEFFYAWAQFCSVAILDGDGGTEPRCAFNSIIDETTDTFSLVHKIAAVGRANTYWKGHQLTGWIDDVVATPIDLVTMDSMMNKTWKNAWSIKKELAGIVEVFYKDKKQGYERTSAELGDSNAGSLDNSISLDGLGITSRGVAIHYANHLLERNRLILNTNRFKVHKDGFRYKLGKTIRLQSKPANWGKAFRVVSSTANTITVDRVATTEVNAGDVLHIRSYDTVLEVIVTDTYEVDSVVGKVITATISWNVTPIKGNIVAIGTAGDVKLRRIVKLTPTVDNYFNVEVETYDVDLYNADDLNPDNPNVNYVWPKSIVDVNAPLTKSEIEDLISQAIPPQPDIDIPWPSNISWNDNTPSAGYISWSKTDSDDDIIFRLRGVDYEITPDNTNDEFVYFDPAFPTIFKTTNILSTAFTLGKWVMCRNKDGVAYPATPIAIMHGGIIQAGTIIANQIIITGINALELLNAPAEPGADVTGERLADFNASLLANWRLDIRDLAGRPAGIYPTMNITNFDQLDWLDGNETEIKTLSTPNAIAGYGFPAVPIDDKQKYGIVIRHKSSAASTDGLYLVMRQYDAALPATKTHIGSSGGTNAQQQTNNFGLALNVALPGTSWVVNEYTYAPTSGTKYATFDFTMSNPNTAGVEYHVDYVLMFLIPKTADEIPDGDTYGQIPKNWKDPADLTKLNGSYIHDLTVNTLQIKGEAVTIGVSAYTEGSIGSGDVQDVTIEATGQPINIIATVRVYGYRSTSDCFNNVDCWEDYELKLFRDGTEIYSTGQIWFMAVNGQWGLATVGFRDTPGAGTYVYKINMTRASSYAKRFLSVQEVKK